jgi:uncharacterized protein
VVAPILHLSLPVADLEASRRFYVDLLGCQVGRERTGWFDVWFHGMQVTLHLEPDQVLAPAEGGVRHFGVTLPMDDLDRLLGRLDGQDLTWLSPVRTEFAGTPEEQRKAKLADPSGNVVELKAYADPSAALEVPDGVPGVLSGGR